MKKLLLLGGLRYLVPVIEAAHKMGHYVITCDYLPDNIAHKFSDEFHNVSILDKEAVLKLAKKLKVDGIMSFAVDPGVLTAAYVCDKLGLPSPGPYESVELLQNKAKFRDFLARNGFNVTKAKGYSKIEDVFNDINFYNWPVIIKPVDSAGSKGVTKANKVEDLKVAIETALKFSHSGQFIIEEFIEKEGFSSDSDCFSLNGKLVQVTFSDQRFDEKAINPYVPAAYSWPSSMNDRHQSELTNELQRLISLLNMQSSLYNVETRIGKNGKAYIMEVSPRGGGNRIAEMIKNCTGQDMITNSVKVALGDENIDIKPFSFDGYWAEVILQSDKTGVFQDLIIDKDFRRKYIVEIDLWVKKGQKVSCFTGADKTLGTIVMKFNSHKELISSLTEYKNYIKIILN